MGLPESSARSVREPLPLRKQAVQFVARTAFHAAQWAKKSRIPLVDTGPAFACESFAMWIEPGEGFAPGLPEFPASPLQLLVEAAGIEPASENAKSPALHA